MPRQPRILLSQSYYHVMARGNNRMTIFWTASDYQRYLDLMDRFKTTRPFDLFHYCLMPNHVHYLVRTKDAQNFATFMKQLNLAYYHYFRKKYGWVGHFWQGRYKNQPVGKDGYFLQSGKYIELNAPRAGLVENPEDWPWSSYHTYAHGKRNTLLTEDIFYAGLGKTIKERQQAYRTLIVDELIHKTYKQTVWGSHQQRYREQQKLQRNSKSQIPR